MIVIVMGPAGSGKTTVGDALARRLGWPFLDADDLHTAGNVAKMRDGIGLTDEDRGPWLARVNARLREMARLHGHGVLACSALRARYRDTIAADVPEVRWVRLEADAALLTERRRTRTGHFAGAALVPGQLAALEPPADAVTVSAADPVDVIVDRICRALGISN
jgi:gluconokinase